MNIHKIPQVQDLENSLHQDSGSNNEHIVLEEKLLISMHRKVMKITWKLKI